MIEGHPLLKALDELETAKKAMQNIAELVERADWPEEKGEAVSAKIHMKRLEKLIIARGTDEVRAKLINDKGAV